MKTCLTLAGATALAVAASIASNPARAQQAPPDEALVRKARAIHEKVITLDTHVDINAGNFMLSRNYTQDLGNQVNLPKMKKGGLDASFFIVYVGQSSGEDAFQPAGYQRAYESAVEKFEAIHRLTKVLAPDQVELALTAADVRRINAKGKKIALIGVENGYPIGTDIRRVKEFYDRGGRYMSLAHNGHSQLADSNTGEATGQWLHNGLSPLGRQVIEEMNKWGIIVDISHPSKEANLQAIALSKAPVIASHSSARALCNHSRNLDDEQLLAVKKNGGVVQTVGFAGYVKETTTPERTAALDALRKEFGLPAGTPLNAGGRGGRAGGPAPGPAPAGAGAPAAGGGRQGGGRGQNTALAALSDEKRAELTKRLAGIDQTFPAPARANVKDFVDHIDYIVKKIGIDHVGISSDFDGGGGVDGWGDAAETFNVTLELVRRGYTEAQIDKLWSGNLLRVMDDVQKVAQTLQK